MVVFEVQVKKQMRKKEKIYMTKPKKRIVTVELKLSFSSRKIHQVAFCDNLPCVVK